MRRRLLAGFKGDCQAECFLDIHDIAKGDHFDQRIFDELPYCSELIALLTPWAAERNWVWVEIGAARALQKRVVGVLYGLKMTGLENERGGMACLNPTNVMSLNDFEAYLPELERRVKDGVE